jgi:hypothetical protein
LLVLPTRLLVDDTAPTVGLVPLLNVTAPALVAEPLFQYGLSVT